jgi:hypothetical protein
VRPPTAGEEERPGKGKECPVGLSEPGTWRKPFPELELMAEHDDLVVLLEPAETMNPQKIQGTPDETEEEREGQGRRGSPRHRGWSSGRSRFVHSTPWGQQI